MRKVIIYCLIFLSLILFLRNEGFSLDKNNSQSLSSLLPKIPSWKITEDPENYVPETLYEHINGAAEIYLIYEFKRLLVAQYVMNNSDVSMTLEIYDMGNEKNAFGIYSVERFPESNFISIGNGGYVEEGVLNFIVGNYYIKLLCFDCEENSDKTLELFANKVLNQVTSKGELPSLLNVFPQEGLVKYSEKFVLRNFLGFGFFHNGYMAEYKLVNYDFECFILEGKDNKDAEQMLQKYLEFHSKGNKTIEKTPPFYHLKDSYYKNIYITKTDNFICGVQRIEDGAEDIGKKFLKILADSVFQSQ